MILNPDHITIAVADAGPAIAFFALLGFKKGHVATIDGGVPARYMGMPAMKAQHITLALEGANPRFEIQLLAFDPPPGTDPGAHPTNLRKLASITSRSASTTSRRPPRTSWPTASPC